MVLAPDAVVTNKTKSPLILHGEYQRAFRVSCSIKRSRSSDVPFFIQHISDDPGKGS
jgi:hypothetical protein